MLQQDTNQIAKSFVAARRAARAIDAFPGAIPDSLAAAYHIQDAAIGCFGDIVAGWKVGRILPPLSDRYGADRLAGPIFEPMLQSADDATGQIFLGGFGAAEAEFLLQIGTAPQPGKMRYTLDEAAGHVGAVHVGIEIASSPLATINALGGPVIISDFGNNNGLIIGPEISDWRDSGFEDWAVTTWIDGVEAGTGTATAFPDGAIGSVRFLLELMAQRQIALPPGTWISTGAVSGVHSVEAGQSVVAIFDDAFTVSCRIDHARAT